MRSSRQHILINTCLSLFLALMIGLGTGVSYANSGHHAKGGYRDNGGHRAERGLDSAVARIQHQTGGRVLRARQKGSRYIIKVLMPSGVVKTFRINAQRR